MKKRVEIVFFPVESEQSGGNHVCFLVWAVFNEKQSNDNQQDMLHVSKVSCLKINNLKEMQLVTTGLYHKLFPEKSLQYKICHF